jgi:hypothetical protein
MASERQIAANRRNAQKSTGPRTKTGKARASGNPYRHGLRSRRPISQSRSQGIEELARKIAGNASPIVLEWARTAAEAELDLARLRRIRAILIEQAIRPSELPPRLPLSSVTEIRLLHRWRKNSNMSLAGANSAASLPLAEPDRTVEGMRQLLSQLQIIARYEQRAWSRRQKNLRSITQALSLKPEIVNCEGGPRRDPPPI